MSRRRKPMALRIKDDIPIFVKHYEKGMSVSAISRKMRVCRNTVYQILRANEIELKNDGRKARTNKKKGGAIA
jgi:transposase